MHIYIQCTYICIQYTYAKILHTMDIDHLQVAPCERKMNYSFYNAHNQGRYIYVSAYVWKYVYIMCPLEGDILYTQWTLEALDAGESPPNLPTLEQTVRIPGRCNFQPTDQRVSLGVGGSNLNLDMPDIKLCYPNNVSIYALYKTYKYICTHICYIIRYILYIYVLRYGVGRAPGRWAWWQGYESCYNM